MKTTDVKIGKQHFSLAFTLGAMEELEEKIEDFRLDDLQKYVKSPKGLLDIITALARQGEALDGRELAVNREWFAQHLSPSPIRISQIQVAVLNALSEGLRMEAEDENEGEVDVVLEELKKKESKEG